MANATHCSSCGSTDAEDLTTGDGYTGCCNKRTCYGGGQPEHYGTPDLAVAACCWGVAEQVYDRAGVEIPEGACRLQRPPVKVLK